MLCIWWHEAECLLASDLPGPHMVLLQAGDAVQAHLKEAHVEVKAYEAFVGDVEAAVHAGQSLWADPARVRPVPSLAAVTSE